MLSQLQLHFRVQNSQVDGSLPKETYWKKTKCLDINSDRGSEFDVANCARLSHHL